MTALGLWHFGQVTWAGGSSWGGLLCSEEGILGTIPRPG